MLRSLCGFAAQDVGDALGKLAGLPNVQLEDSSAVAQALSWLETSIDFADGLHRASRTEANSFLTFDERVAERTATLRIVTRLILKSAWLPKNKGRLSLKKQPFLGS
jgi:hypothetical protein